MQGNPFYITATAMDEKEEIIVDVAMGVYNRGEVCELIGMFMPSLPYFVNTLTRIILDSI